MCRNVINKENKTLITNIKSKRSIKVTVIKRLKRNPVNTELYIHRISNIDQMDQFLEFIKIYTIEYEQLELYHNY